MTKNFDFLSFIYMRFTWETNPARRNPTLTRNLHPTTLVETQCATLSIVYIMPNKDDQIVNTL